MIPNHPYPVLKLHIDGEWVTAGDRNTQTVVNPASGESLGDVPLANAGDLDRALAASDRAFQLWRKSSGVDRAQVLSGAARLIRERSEGIAINAVLEEGKTLPEARMEAAASAALFDFYAGEAQRIYGRVLPRPSGQRTMVLKEPVGPVAAFAPWNFPINNPARKLGAPIAAGCSVILKPAEETPASAMAVLQALIDAGLPNGVAQLVFGVPDDVSRHLIASPVTRKLSFTGSTVVGKHLAALATNSMMRMTMELGGHAPVIIFDDADLDRALDQLAPAKLRNCGQVCICPTRFYVQDGIYDTFVSALAQRLSSMKVGHGLDSDSHVGPMANPRRPDAMESLIADAVRAGATIEAGGERIDCCGYFYQPTVLGNVPIDARIMNEEPFGPVAVTARFSTFDDAVQQANRLPYGLAAYAFTENGRQANLIADAIESGMVGVNTTRIAAADAPFQGVKESGFGSEDGPEGVEACLTIKTTHFA